MQKTLKGLREEKKLTQTAMAEILGMSISNYHKKEMGQLKFSLEESKKISDFFRMPIEAIFFGNDFAEIANINE